MLMQDKIQALQAKFHTDDVRWESDYFVIKNYIILDEYTADSIIDKVTYIDIIYTDSSGRSLFVNCEFRGNVNLIVNKSATMLNTYINNSFIYIQNAEYISIANASFVESSLDIICDSCDEIKGMSTAFYKAGIVSQIYKKFIVYIFFNNGEYKGAWYAGNFYHSLHKLMDILDEKVH